MTAYLKAYTFRHGDRLLESSPKGEIFDWITAASYAHRHLNLVASIRTELGKRRCCERPCRSTERRGTRRGHITTLPKEDGHVQILR